MRVHVHLNRPTTAALRQIVERRDITMTEAVRQAVTTWAWLDAAFGRGARLRIVERDGQVRDVLPMG